MASSNKENTDHSTLERCETTHFEQRRSQLI